MAAFKVKNIFITGGNRGLGFALTKEMLEQFQPDNLFATYRNADKSQELLDLAKKHPNLHAIQFDVTDYSKLPEIVKQVDDKTNGIGVNLLFNNSGILGYQYRGIRDVTREDILSHVETNTVGPTLITQAFLPLLEKAAASNSDEPAGIRRAAIVNMSTLLASIQENTSAGCFSYRTTKAALNMATKCISIDLKDTGITTVMLHPGWVKTDMGGKNATLTIEESVGQMVKTLRGVTGDHNGKFLNFDGKEIPW